MVFIFQGTVQILKNTFDNSAKIVSLNNGKFFIHKFDRFVLVSIKYLANLLYTLSFFYFFVGNRQR